MVDELEILEDKKGVFYFSIKNTKNIPELKDAIVNNLLEKSGEMNLIKPKAKQIKKKFDVRLQKYLFQINYRLLEKIQLFRGMIFIEHLECLNGQSYAELRMQIEIMTRYGLLKLVKIHTQYLLQLTRFSTTKLASHNDKTPTLVQTTILKNAFCGEILLSILKEFAYDREYFLTLIESRSTFLNTNREYDSKKWDKFLKLRKKDVYIFNREGKMDIYLLDIYSTSTTAHKIATRIHEVYTYLLEENLLSETDLDDKHFLLKVSFNVCVDSFDRKVFLESKQSSKIISSYLLKKNLSFANFDIKIISYNLAGKYFAKNRF